MSEWVTQSEYARHRKVVKSYIAKLIKNRRIPPAAVKGEGKERRIDLAAADLALGETIERVVAREQESDDDADDGQGHSGGGAGDGAGAGLTKAKTASAFYQANLARLQFEEKTGKLVSRADLELSMQRAAEALGRDIDQIAARADDIATAFTRGGVDGVRSFLKALTREIRATISRNMRLLEQSESEPDESESHAA